MHGAQLSGIHPFNSPIKLWWGRKSGEADPLAPGAERPIPSLFDPVKPEQMFRAGGLISANGIIIDRTELHRLISTLAARVSKERDRLNDVPDNDSLPSGYTYFLQFMAHDLVDTSAPPAIAAGARFNNARSRALRLDTLYGAGPGQSPHAYAFGEEQAQQHGNIPRTKLRIGPLRPVDSDLPAGAFCPRRDIARGEKPRCADSQLEPNPSDPNLPNAPQPKLLTEPQLADARNDSHAIISQLTVLFQLLHNHIFDTLKKHEPAETDAPRERAFRIFLCARSSVEMIFRDIVENDVLPKIIDPRILTRYRDRKALWTPRWRGAPLEFSFGAFRFAHSIARDSYVVNNTSDEGNPLGDALLRSSGRAPSPLPMTANWIVDWVNFFPLDGAPANLSKRIGPHYANDLTNDEDFPLKVPGLDQPGLASRDLFGASFAGLLSVRSLIEKLQPVFGRDIIGDFDAWRVKIKEWMLQGQSDIADETLRRLDLIADDPPLCFFVMFEAQYAPAPEEQYAEISSPGGGAERISGKYLGPLGSAIVAETIFAALSAASFDFEAPATPLEERIQTCAIAMLGPWAGFALAELPDLGSMPRLIKYLKASGLFDNP